MLRYIDSAIDSNDNEILTVDGRDMYEAMSRQVEQDLGEIAGLKPLPRSRMARQAGRLKNKMTKGGSAGRMLFTRQGMRTLRLSPQEAQTLMRSDPQFRRSYEKQVKNGERSDMTDKYDGIVEFNDGRIITNVYKPYMAGGVVQRESITRDEVNRQTIERQQRNAEATNNWDPIEASAKEDYNRLKGGRRGPLPTVNSGLEMIETIDTPSNPSQSVQQIITPGV